MTEPTAGDACALARGTVQPAADGRALATLVGLLADRNHRPGGFAFPAT